MGRRERILDSMIGVIVLVVAGVVVVTTAVPLAIGWLLWKGWSSKLNRQRARQHMKPVPGAVDALRELPSAQRVT
jgi:hypothetical protein